MILLKNSGNKLMDELVVIVFKLRGIVSNWIFGLVMIYVDGFF